MKKYRVLSAKKAVKKGLIKVGDEIWVKTHVGDILLRGFVDKLGCYLEKTIIRIPIQETKQKPIDFSEAGRVLKNGNDIIRTTGDKTSRKFSGYVLESDHLRKGFASFKWVISDDWQDITDIWNS